MRVSDARILMPGSMHYILAMTMIATGATAQVRLPTVSLPGAATTWVPKIPLARYGKRAAAQSRAPASPGT